MVTHHTSTMLNIAGCYFESFNSFEQKLGALSTICSRFKAQHITFFPSYVLKERANLFFFSGISGLQKAFQSGEKTPSQLSKPQPLIFYFILGKW